MQKINPDELLGISKAIDSIKSAFPAVVQGEKDAIQKPLEQVQQFCDTKYKDLTGKRDALDK